MGPADYAKVSSYPEASPLSARLEEAESLAKWEFQSWVIQSLSPEALSPFSEMLTDHLAKVLLLLKGPLTLSSPQAPLVTQRNQA